MEDEFLMVYHCLDSTQNFWMPDSNEMFGKSNGFTPDFPYYYQCLNTNVKYSQILLNTVIKAKCKLL